MSIVKTCGRQIILLINGLFRLVGLVCFVGGMFVKYGSDDLKSMLPELMNELVKKVVPILKATHKSSSDFLDNLDLDKLLGEAAVVFIVFGAILLFIVFWGCYDTPIMCCTNAERSKSTNNWWRCAMQPLTRLKSNFEKGCYDEVWRYLEKYVNIVVGCVGGLIGLELVLAFFAIYIAKGMDKKNKVDSEKGRKRKK
ncbi:uncharacterized protein LOC134239423 [Saccostrea cucullata]|uniref:uncharacterized protein LOC134239423 n=1 Tax=Saccostrea cuccullata TaxID=36930 RepID=UPI002ED207B9